MSASDIVSIHVTEYQALLRNRRFLAALEARGVDNWDGYSDAYNDAFPEENEEEPVEN